MHKQRNCGRQANVEQEKPVQTAHGDRCGGDRWSGLLSVIAAVISENYLRSHFQGVTHKFDEICPAIIFLDPTLQVAAMTF